MFEHKFEVSEDRKEGVRDWANEQTASGCDRYMWKAERRKKSATRACQGKKVKATEKHKEDENECQCVTFGLRIRDIVLILATV